MLALRLGLAAVCCAQLHLGSALPSTAAAKKAKIPTIPIGKDVDGKDVLMPMAGLGTWQYNDSVVEGAVATALSLGYTHLDCALGYNNQLGVAKGIAASGRKRESMFITSKIPGGLNTSATKAALELSIKQLGVKYVDLMLVHFPASWGGDGGKEGRVEEWKAMEAFYKEGKAKTIGVSHYCERHIDDILAIATVKPAVNQVQFHVGMGGAGLNATDMPTKGYKGVVYEGFSPLCGPCGTTELIDGPLVVGIGKKHGKSGAQVSLKWQVQQGIPVIPKASKKSYIKENIELFDWTLSDAEMKQLSEATSPGVAGDKGASTDCAVP